MCPVRHAGNRIAENDIKLIPFMKALTKGRETFPEYMKHGPFYRMHNPV